MADRGRSTTLSDQTPYNRHGTLTSMDPATDWVTRDGYACLDFDGSNDYVSTPATGVVSSYAQRTIMGWLRIGSTGANQALWGSGRTTGLSGAFLRISSANKVQYFENSGAYNVAGATSLTTGVWYHVAAARTVNGVIIYLNGKEDGTDSSRSAATDTQDTTDLIGAIWSSGSVANNFTGHIASVSLYAGTQPAALIQLAASRIGIEFERTRIRTRATAAAAPPSSTSGNLLLLGVG